MNMFIQASSDCWYYFGFEDNRLMIYSSNDEFVDIIASKSNIDKAGFGEYVFVNADLPDVLKFVDRFRLQYLGITDPYEISMPTEEISDGFDILEIPVDNTEDGDVLPADIVDNTEDDDVLPMDIVDNTEESLNPIEDEEKSDEDKPVTEEDLLKPKEEKAEEEEEEDDEGF